MEEAELRSRGGSPSGDFLGIALDSESVYSAGLVKTIYRCEDLKKSANAKARKLRGGAGGVSCRKARNTARRCLSTQTEIRTWLVCGPGAQDCTGQDSQMFPLIPQPWRDLAGHPAPRLSLHSDSAGGDSGGVEAG